MQFKNYLSLVKFSHTIFALPFAMIGFFLAINSGNVPFDLLDLLLIILCMVFARNSAMSFNRFVDRSIDKKNPRTASREVPSGVISPNQALIFAIINAVLFVATTYLINDLVFFLSPLALFIVLGYSFTKRFTYLCHLILGLGLSLAPIGAYLAVTGKWDYTPLLFSLIVLLWVAGFDIIYSIQDEDFDKEESLKSVPAIFGRRTAKIISVILHFITILLVIKSGLMLNANIFYWIGATLFIVILIWEHITVRFYDKSKINFAFATLNGLASILFSIFVILSFYL